MQQSLAKLMQPAEFAYIESHSHPDDLLLLYHVLGDETSH